ncbi:MAG: methyltransferase domain-containing protein [Thermoleophilaceae bacterium]
MASRLLYERRYKAETTEAVDLDELGLAADGRGRYEPSDWRVLARVLPRRAVSSDDVFVDIGSGMGRVVLQAAMRYRFRRVIGVELAEGLTETARRNVERNRTRLRCKDVELIAADATAYELPDDVTVVFLYNPFGGELFERVIANVVASLDRRPRRLRVIYKNPIEHERILGTGRFRVTSEWKRPSARFLGRPDPGVTRTYETAEPAG